jgi:TPR repeat protein
MHRAQRETAKDWLEFCAERDDWQAGDEPTVMISYAGEDLKYVEKLRKHLDIALSRVRTGASAFSAWDYARFRSGTALGSHFPTEVATQMWRCRAAIVLLSPDYVNSRFCFEIELPFLLWRMHHQGMRLFVLRLNTTVIDGDLFELPDFRFPAEKINLMHFVDDRNPALMDRFDTHSEKMLKELDSERPDKAEARLAAYARAICELLTLDEAKRTAPASGPTAQPVPHQMDQIVKREPDMAAERPKQVSSQRSKVGLIAAGLAAALVIAVFALTLRSSPTPPPVAVLTPPKPEPTAPSREAAQPAYQNPSAPAVPSVPKPDIASAKDACHRAAASPADPVKTGPGIPFPELDPAMTGLCQHALDLDPDDGTIAFETARLLEKAGRQHEAFERYLAAYARGNALAANNIGVLFRDEGSMFAGAAGIKDQNSCASQSDCDARAVTWFARAVDRSVDPARYNLALMLEAGRGVDPGMSVYGCAPGPDCDRLAVDQFALAAAKGDADAELHLAWLYLQHRGVTDRTDDRRCQAASDCDQAGMKWLMRSLAKGGSDAKAYADALYRSRPDLKPE